MIKGIVFDFWGTLVENGIYPSPVQQTKFILRMRMPFKDFVARFEKSMMVKPYTDLNEAFKAACDEFRITPDQYLMERLVGMWNKNDLLGKPFLDTIETLDYLKSKKIKIGLIANTTPSITRVIEKYNLEKYFTANAFSYEEGLLKSDAEMYHRMVEKMKLKPEEVVVIGDSVPSDVIGARNAGLKSILLDRRNNREFQPKIINLRELMSLIEEGSLEEFATLKSEEAEAVEKENE
ncbi:MAG: HAD family hydrolase [archaeon]